MSTVSLSSNEELSNLEWKGYEKFAFRTFFIFFFLLAVPLEFDYYTNWFNLDWRNLHIRDLGGLGGGGIRFTTIRTESGEFGLASYVNWGIALIFGLIGAGLWSVLDRNTKNYTKLFYFASAAVSISMLARLTGLTFSKVFPSQMPELALTQLNTNFGDFTPQKLYWIQLSFVPSYEIFIGFAELLIMALLFFRQTRAVGAALSLFIVGNISIANHVYDGGVHVLASYYAIGGTFVLWRYLPNAWNLLVKGKDVTPLYYYSYDNKWAKYFRIIFKLFVFFIFFLLSAYLHWDNYKNDSYKVPARPGLKNSRGYYNVTEFKVNGKILPYSPVDSVRWRDVTFEKWSTISYSVFRKLTVHNEAGRGKQYLDVDRTFESAGTGGGRRHYYYEQDTVKHTLKLQNKNKLYRKEKIFLHYERPKKDQFILTGNNEFKDSIDVILDRVDRNYLLYDYYEQDKYPLVWKSY